MTAAVSTHPGIAARLLRPLLAGAGRLWLRSLRIRWSGEALPAKAVLVLWHEHLPACVPAFARRNVAVLISRSADGDWAADACRNLGYRVYRGSSSRNSPQGMKALARALAEENGLAGMALDGPRGPYRAPKPGSVWLAGKAGVPIVPIAVRVPFHFRLRTWDRSIVPLPFSRVEIYLGAAFHPDDAAELAAAMEANQAGLDAR